MSDLISRHAAIEAIDRYYKDKRYITRSRTILSAICRDMKSTMDSLPSVQPEPAIPLSWIEGQIKWLKSLDNAFSALAAGQISAMVNKWKDEQDEIDKPDEKN